MDFNLSVPVRVISSENCVIKNSGEFSRFGKKCIIVTGGKSALLSGALEDVKAALEKENISSTVYDRVGPNPLLSICREGGKLAREFGADFVIGIGGGSPLDAAKAVAVYATNENFEPYDIYTQTERNKALPLVLIGTTAGTGSEVGRVSVLTSDETGRKKSISPADCNPSLTFADPKYTYSMPYGVTVSTALDALSHAIEGYFSSKCTDIPSLFAEKAVELIWEGLKELHKTKNVPDEKMREKLYYGSLYAGITLSYCGTAFPHPLGYVLTENYGTPHGMACAAFMPELIIKAGENEKEKLAKILEITGETTESFISLIKALTSLESIEMTKEEIKEYCSRWDNVKINNFIFSPGGYTKEEAEEAFFKFVK